MRSLTFDRDMFNIPSKLATQQAVLPKGQDFAKATHPRSIHRGVGATNEYVERHPNAAKRWRGRTKGPMATFMRAVNLKKVGAKLRYSKAMSRWGVNTNKQGQTAYHPMSQEFGAPTAEPAITENRPRPMARATQAGGKKAIAIATRLIRSKYFDRAVNNATFRRAARQLR